MATASAVTAAAAVTASVAVGEPLPREFCQRILSQSEIPNTDGLLEALASGCPSLAIRYNRLKHCSPPPDARTVPWCPQGEYLAERPNFTLDPRLHQGLYYVQDPSSMAIGRVIESLGLDAPVNYLDACAAPGGKTTCAVDALPQGSFIVANEADPGRAAALDENLVRWGCPDVAVTVGPAQKLSRLPRETFQVIAADVPCSGEGMMRKDPAARVQWTPRLVDQCASLQRDILASLWPLLSPGGYLIYSTCTFSRQENEDNVAWLVEEFGAEQLPLPAMDGVAGGHFYPHIIEGEGLYMALLRKPGIFGRHRQIGERDLAKATRLLRFGSADWEMKGRDRIPSHAQALRYDFVPSQWPTVDVDPDTARHFLHRDPIALPDGTPRGITLVTYDGRPLGWVNNLGSRANNLLPRHLRILQNI